MGCWKNIEKTTNKSKKLYAKKSFYPQKNRSGELGVSTGGLGKSQRGDKRGRNIREKGKSSWFLMKSARLDGKRDTKKFQWGLDGPGEKKEKVWANKKKTSDEGFFCKINPATQ